MLQGLLEWLHAPIYQHRIATLASLIAPHLQPNDSVLDIGCGSGMLGRAVLHHGGLPPGVRYRGIEKSKRGGEPIEVIEHKTGSLPFADGEFDVVLLADVLHHEENESGLIAEAVRVSKRYVIIKDHTPEGVLGYWRVCLLDWAANNPYDVKCLYRYHTRKQWHGIFSEHQIRPVLEKTSIDLYPSFFNLFFGKRLQYFVVLTKSGWSPPAHRNLAQNSA